MSRRSSKLSSGDRDGTSQQWRSMAALDPTSVAIDERRLVDHLEFVRAFTKQLRFFAATPGAELPQDVGTWAAFADHGELALADIEAYVRDPERFTGEPARWLARPHFALLLTFLELLDRYRDHLGGLVPRHLEHYYRDVLRLRPQPAEPDRVAAIFSLGERAADAFLPAGTALEAGRDGADQPRIYRSERDLWVSHARVAELRSLFIHRRIVGVSDVCKQPGLSGRDVLEQMLGIALGDPNPGDPVPQWQKAPVDQPAITALGPLLRFARDKLKLEHHELRALMRLVRRRAAADFEWTEINRRLGVESPADPRAFMTNLTAVVGPLDFAADGLPQVRSVDDLHQFRGEPDVRDYIDARLAPIGFKKFSELMAIKRRIDVEWAEVNRTLERIGRSARNDRSWRLAPGDPADFARNLARALGAVSWPAGVAGIDAYEAKLRELEVHFSMTAEQLLRLVTFADKPPPRDDPRWREAEAILEGAHREKFHAARRARLAAARGQATDVAAFDAEVAAALGAPPGWPEARAALLDLLDGAQVRVLDTFRAQFTDADAPRPYTWADVDRVLELASCIAGSVPEPVAQRVEWRNLHVLHDATAARSEDETRWKIFGRCPPGADQATPPPPSLGWALRSPLLALSGGTRTLTLTLGLRGLDRAALLRGLGGKPTEKDAGKLRDAVAAAIRVDVAGANGPLELPLTGVRIASGGPGDDYATWIGAPRPGEGCPALQLVLTAPPQLGPIAAPADADAPTLRLTLRQRWDGESREWLTTYAPFERLELAGVHVRVDVAGLTDLRLQHEDRELDPRKPSEPFGLRPVAGARLRVWHPELAGRCLTSLRLDLSWMGLPASLKQHYQHYPGISGGAGLRARVWLYDQRRELLMHVREAKQLAADPPSQIDDGKAYEPAPGGVDEPDVPLFRDDARAQTARGQALTIPDVGAAILKVDPRAVHDHRPAPAPGRDLRTADRHLVLELVNDFGHVAYPTITATKARELAIALASGTLKLDDADKFTVSPPYTPTLLRLSATYRSELELDPRALADDHRLLHIHPFGEAAIDPAEPRLFPRHDGAGELYIGLADAVTPQKLSLLLQLAEGTSDPDRPAATVAWSALDGDTWRPLAAGTLHDSTRGLINTGIVELDLPRLAPATRLPGDLTWLRVSVLREPASVCDAVAIHAQAVMLRFDDQDNDPGHYSQPLAAGQVEQLIQPDPRIAEILQPYTSFGGRPAEAPATFYTRVSERLRHKGRALTTWDYERLALHGFPQIYKAKCFRADELGPGCVDLIVINDIRKALPADALAPRAPANLLADIQAYLAARAPTAARVRVRNARYVAVMLRLAVCFQPGQDERRSRARLQDDLRRFLSPWAYDEGAELMIGGKIYASSIVDYVDRLDYVDYVADLTLLRCDDGVTFRPVAPTDEDYHVATTRPDQVLVSAREHDITAVTEQGNHQPLSTGINYMRVDLDFIVL